MYGTVILDSCNTLNPDLDDIMVSSKMTFLAGESWYKSACLVLEKYRNKIPSSTTAYIDSHNVASQLAFACEQYLKAIYIFENNIPGNQIDQLWDELKTSDYKVDKNGQLVYLTPNNIITYLKYDDDGNPIKDDKGKNIYFDDEGNTYNDLTKGSKIKRSGHQLDRLIEMISERSRKILEYRMLSINSFDSEKDSKISLLDFIHVNGEYPLGEKYLTEEVYTNWIEQHKKTFEEARYPGQKNHNVNVEFMFHLATQLRALTKYLVEMNDSYSNKVSREDIEKLPVEFVNFLDIHKKVISDEIISLSFQDETIMNKIIELSKDKRNWMIGFLSSFVLIRMLKYLNIDEILYIAAINYVIAFNKLHILKNTLVTGKIIDELIKRKLTDSVDILLFYLAYRDRINNSHDSVLNETNKIFSSYVRPMEITKSKPSKFLIDYKRLQNKKVVE